MPGLGSTLERSSLTLERPSELSKMWEQASAPSTTWGLASAVSKMRGLASAVPERLAQGLPRGWVPMVGLPLLWRARLCNLASLQP